LILSINCLKGKVTSGKIMQQQYDRIESLYPEIEAATVANPALAAQALAAARQVIALNGSKLLQAAVQDRIRAELSAAADPLERALALFEAETTGRDTPARLWKRNYMGGARQFISSTALGSALIANLGGDAGVNLFMSFLTKSSYLDWLCGMRPSGWPGIQGRDGQLPDATYKYGLISRHIAALEASRLMIATTLGRNVGKDWTALP
jgi:hypothetical protein